ncbi:MAG: T9SS type A sorting domain-containing protein [Chitinophagales bacterium]
MKSQSRFSFLLKYEQEETLRGISKSVTRAAFQARNILKMVYDEDFVIDVPYLSENQERLTAETNNSTESSFTVYPNPADGNFIVNLLLQGEDNESWLLIFNTLGQQVYAALLLSGENFIQSPANFADGMFLCRVTCGNSMIGETKLFISTK